MFLPLFAFNLSLEHFDQSRSDNESSLRALSAHLYVYSPPSVLSIIPLRNVSESLRD